MQRSGRPTRLTDVIHPPPEPARELAPLVPGLPADLRRWAAEVARVVVLTAALFLVVSTFVAQPFQVELRSMEPTLIAGDFIVVDKLTPRWDPYDRGDVVVFGAPPGYADDGIPYVKRVIGVAGDTVELANGRVYVRAPGGPPERLEEGYLVDDLTLPQGTAATHSWTVPDGSVFVMGDNRGGSLDSRSFGPIAEDSIVGRAVARYLPLDRLAIIGAETTAASPAP